MLSTHLQAPESPVYLPFLPFPLQHLLPPSQLPNLAGLNLSGGGQEAGLAWFAKARQHMDEVS